MISSLRPLALTLWLSVATLTGTRLWFVYPDFTPPFSPAFGVWLVTVLHWPKGDVELALFVSGNTVPHLAGLGAVADVVSALAMPPPIRAIIPA